MSSPIKPNIQIATNNLTLEELEQLKRQAVKPTVAPGPEFRSTLAYSPLLYTPNANLRPEEPTSQINVSDDPPPVTSASDESARKAPTSTRVANVTSDHGTHQPVETVASTRDANVQPPQAFPVVSVPEVKVSSESIGQPVSDTRLHRMQNEPVYSIPFIDNSNHRPDSDAAMPLATTIPVDESVHHQTSVPVQDAMIQRHVANEAGNDISERPGDWLPDDDSGEKRSDKKANTLDAPEKAFLDLTQEVLDQFPLGPSTLLLVADVDGRSCGHTVALQLARHLANRNVGRVLAVDSHFESRRLTSKLNLESEPGLADVLAVHQTLDHTICETDMANLDFLPVGSKSTCAQSQSGNPVLAEVIHKLKNDYQFVVVSVGDVFHRATTLWGRHCDATYMAIEMMSANQTLAKSGVVRLQQFGARLMGCVVTDAAA